MNQKIKNLDIEKILFWDLESVRANKELVPDSEEYNLYEHKTRKPLSCKQKTNLDEPR